MPAGDAELAPAKVNLALHVTGRRRDGYHLLDSLVVFPAIGDLVEAEPAAGLSLTLDGPFARDLGAGPENLVLRAAQLIRPAGQGAAIRLVKALPVASGIGGGSSDAAATLRLLARLWKVPLPPTGQTATLGADVPVCLRTTPQRLQGIGERLTPVELPPFWIVLANPGFPLSTPAVFAGLAQRDNTPLPDLPARFGTPDALFDWLGRTRNHLEAPAIALQPAIGPVLDALAAQAGCGMARMSGSGATCFGAFAGEIEALAAATALRRAEPAWWIAAGQVEV
jgi:4-diphosphocytidyl-2-C-methyl-D-erythritol kinase